MDKELTPKQQTSEAIRQAEAILIMTGQRPNIDQVASTIALAAILRKFGKKVTAVISDELPAGARFLPTNLIERTLGGLRDFTIEVDLSHAEVDKVSHDIEDGKLNVHITPFAGSLQQRDVSFSHGDFHFDLVIILGVPSYSRIDRVFQQNAEMLRQAPLVNVDFHRINEQYGAINLVETGAASLAEILMALSESLQAGLIDESIATPLLAGIMAATDRFTAYHTTAKSMTVAAQMMALGADQQKIVKGLYRGGDRDRDRDRRPQSQSQSSSQTQAPSVQQTQSASAKPDRLPQALPQSQPRSPQRPPAQPEPEREQPAEKLAAPATQAQESSQTPKSEEPVVPREQNQRSDKVKTTPLDTLPESSEQATEPKSTESYDEPELPTVPLARPATANQDESEPLTPVITEAKEPEAPAMEELLPPQHIEMSRSDSPENQPAMPGSDSSKAANPTNNPVFHHRRQTRQTKR